MSYEVLRYIFIGAAALSGAMLIVSILLFIILKIPRVIGDLTGATARKAIENIRNQNESSGDKIYKSSAVNRERGKLTDKISASGNISHHENNPLGGAMATTKIATQGLSENAEFNETTVLGADTGNETTVLDNETTVLDNETTVLDNGTTVLSSPANETTVLSPQDDQTAILNDSQSRSKIFEIEYEITFIHTNEVIA